MKWDFLGHQTGQCSRLLGLHQATSEGAESSPSYLPKEDGEFE